MAIIEELGVEVKVQIGASAATEYIDPEPYVDNDAHSQTTNICHRYVESVDNAEFAIHVGLIPGTNVGQQWIGSSRKHALSFSVTIDGTGASKTTVRHDKISKLLEGIHSRENQTFTQLGPYLVFQFCRYLTTLVDDTNKERITTDMTAAQNLGLIRVCVQRATVSKSRPRKNLLRHDLKWGTDGLSFAEKALKGRAISHRTA
ncbi:hypothetical protein F5883DRAFT_477156 [Diaporthe sp. PMI_573]|nr:hypothetical protein F5883DRAFT_477156 [Diaporthaceae sp. PMI_573]